MKMRSASDLKLQLPHPANRATSPPLKAFLPTPQIPLHVPPIQRKRRRVSERHEGQAVHVKPRNRRQCAEEPPPSSFRQGRFDLASPTAALRPHPRHLDHLDQAGRVPQSEKRNCRHLLAGRYAPYDKPYGARVPESPSTSSQYTLRHTFATSCLCSTNTRRKLR